MEFRRVPPDPHRLVAVVRQVSADLIDERARRLELEREVRELRTRPAAYESREPESRTGDVQNRQS
jgi:hypothetical protein